MAVLGLSALAALIVWKRRQPDEADGGTVDVLPAVESPLIDDELAA